MAPAAPAKMYKNYNSAGPSKPETSSKTENTNGHCEPLKGLSDDQRTTTDEDEPDCSNKIDEQIPNLLDLSQLHQPEIQMCSKQTTLCDKDERDSSPVVGVDTTDSQARREFVNKATDQDSTISSSQEILNGTTDDLSELNKSPKNPVKDIVDVASRPVVAKITRETQTERSHIYLEAVDICMDVVDMTLQKDREVKLWNSWSPRSSSSAIMFQLCNEILDGHAIVYKSMVDKLELVNRRNFWPVKSMCDEVFSGGEVSWGRIIAVYAVCVQLARSCRLQSQPEDVAYTMADTIGHYVGSMADYWIIQKGGWGALVKEFPPKDDLQKRIWKTLLVTGLSLGMFATVIKAIR